MKRYDKKRILGWIAVGLSTIITSFWAFWGIIENFHEGWYYESLLSNIGLMFAQYLSPMLIFMGVTLISIFWPRLGGGLHVLFALAAAWFFQVMTNTVMLLLIAPLIGLGVGYWHPADAYSLAMALSSTEAGLESVINGTKMPSPRESVWGHPEVQEVSHPIMADALEWMASQDGPFPHPSNLRFQELQDTWANTSQELFYGDVGFEEGMEAVQTACQEIMELPIA